MIYYCNSFLESCFFVNKFSPYSIYNDKRVWESSQTPLFYDLFLQTMESYNKFKSMQPLFFRSGCKYSRPNTFHRNDGHILSHFEGDLEIPTPQWPRSLYFQSFFLTHLAHRIAIQDPAHQIQIY